MDRQAEELEAFMNEQFRRWRAAGADVDDVAAAAVAAAVQRPPVVNRNPPGNQDGSSNNNSNNVVDADGADSDAIGGEEETGDGDFRAVPERLDDGSYEGGVARSTDDPSDPSSAWTKSSDCDLILFIECAETVPSAPDHPLVKPGVAVAIGFSRSTKLANVFAQYVRFCNITVRNHPTVTLDMLEFVHCQLLDGGHTAEVSALMKNDRIKVRRNRAQQRSSELERKRIQRDADKEYFKQLKQLMPDLGGARVADIVLDCRGTLADQNGRNQQVLCTTVKAHSAILCKRSKWFSDIISQARKERDEALIRHKQQSAQLDNFPEVTMVDQQLHQARQDVQNQQQSDQARQQIIGADNNGDDSRRGDAAAARIGNDAVEHDGQEHKMGEDGIAAINFRPDRARQDSGATAIENDDDSSYHGLDSDSEDGSIRSGSPVPFSQHAHASQNDVLWITINNHSPEAVRLLLEYCYTNRVAPLGYEAFATACKTRPQKHQGPVPPYTHAQSSSRRWPNNRYPTVGLSVVLDAISLAEESSMKRFSLMCEVAASQLLTPGTVVEALKMCARQDKISGNGLIRLRKAAMDILLRNGPQGVSEVERSAALTKILNDRSSDLMPTLMTGVVESVTKDDLSHMSDFEKLTRQEISRIDKKESRERERERKRRRLERHGLKGDSPSIRDMYRPGPFSMDFDIDSMQGLPLRGSAGELSVVPHEVSVKSSSHRLSSSRQHRGSRRNLR